MPSDPFLVRAFSGAPVHDPITHLKSLGRLCFGCRAVCVQNRIGVAATWQRFASINLQIRAHSNATLCPADSQLTEISNRFNSATFVARSI